MWPWQRFSYGSGQYFMTINGGNTIDDFETLNHRSAMVCKEGVPRERGRLSRFVVCKMSTTEGGYKPRPHHALFYQLKTKYVSLRLGQAFAQNRRNYHTTAVRDGAVFMVRACRWVDSWSEWRGVPPSAKLTPPATSSLGCSSLR